MRPAKSGMASHPARGTLCNVTALRKATRRVSQLYDAMLAPAGIRSTQRSILVYVGKSGPPTMSELAASLVLDRSALNHNLKPLQRDGLVTVVVDENDRRSRRIHLTKRGEAKVRDSQAAWKQAQQRFECAFGSKRATALRATLDSLASEDFSKAFALATIS
jgi:DNA-binding MarR family transcriptional regulator